MLLCSAPVAGGAAVHAPAGGAGGDAVAEAGDEEAVPSSSVSQRDLHRVFKALRFFWNHLLRRDYSTKEIIKEPSGRSSTLLQYACCACLDILFSFFVNCHV